MKQDVIQKVKDAADKYARVFVIRVENMRNNKLKEVREEWHHSKFFFGKNKVMAFALGQYQLIVSCTLVCSLNAGVLLLYGFVIGSMVMFITQLCYTLIQSGALVRSPNFFGRLRNSKYHTLTPKTP